MVDLIIRLISQSIDEATEACLDKAAMAWLQANLLLVLMSLLHYHLLARVEKWNTALVN